VLVPVLYLAQPDNRLMANGALIQGRDVTLISGGELNNSGTLRASNDLAASATTIDNRGLIEAGNRLELLATDSIRNAAGGIIAGRDVSLIARDGDIINERSVTTVSGSGSGYQYRADVVTAASRIEAANDLSLVAGRDVHSLGSVIQAGGDAHIEAGRDVLIASQREEDRYSYQQRRETGSQYQVTQHASELQVGGDLAISAGRDLGIIASRVEAVGDITLQAAENLVVAAAANESHEESYRKHAGKKTQRIDSSVSQQQAEIEAGGSLVAVSGSDMTLVASDLRSGDEAFFYAGGELSLLAEQNSDYSLYDMQKKGSWGSKKTQRDEVTTVRNVGTRITSGGELTLVSEGDQLYQRARLDSGADLTLESGGAITFEAVKDLDQESHEKSKSSSMWTSAKGKGTTDETLLQSQLIAQGDIVIKAVDGLKIDIKEVNQQTV
ncbi:hemagglutinin repeat-containing protein, partial [Phytopseudomonas dryadis]